MISECSLCKSAELKLKDFEFKECQSCSLLIRETKLGTIEEKARYLEHNNSLEQKGYKSFLEQIWHASKVFLGPGWQGLDFGSGPTSNMQSLCFMDDYLVDSFDPFFNKIDLKNSYDFILLNEVIEHIRELNTTLVDLLARLKVGGILGIQTSLYHEKISWADWYYRRDKTHVSIFQERTINYLESEFGLKALLKHDNIFIFRKN